MKVSMRLAGGAIGGLLVLLIIFFLIRGFQAKVPGAQGAVAVQWITDEEGRVKGLRIANVGELEIDRVNITVYDGEKDVSKVVEVHVMPRSVGTLELEEVFDRDTVENAKIVSVYIGKRLVARTVVG